MNAIPMDLELVTRRFLEAEDELAELTATLRTLKAETERVEEMRRSAGEAIARLESAAEAARGVFERLLPIVESLGALASHPAVDSIATFPAFLERATDTTQHSMTEMEARVARVMAPSRVLAGLNLVVLIGIGVWMAVRG